MIQTSDKNFDMNQILCKSFAMSIDMCTFIYTFIDLCIFPLIVCILEKGSKRRERI